MRKLENIHFVTETAFSDEREEKNTWKGFVIAFVSAFFFMMIGAITGSKIIFEITVFAVACTTALSMVLLYVDYERWRDNRKHRGIAKR